MDLFDLDFEDLTNLDRSGLEGKLGRKLTLKDRFTLAIIKRELRKKSGIATHLEPLAIIGLLVGLASLPFLGSVLGPCGIVLSTIGIIRIKQAPMIKRGHNLAITGVLLSVVGLLIDVMPLLLAKKN